MPSFIHDTAVVIGNVTLGDDASVWPTAVIRGDLEAITIGHRSNVQDGAIIHADPGHPVVIGDDCVIGHRAIVHSAQVGNGCLIGMGAVLLNRVSIGAGSIVGAGSVCTEGFQAPSGSLVLGTPARVVREIGDAQQAGILDNAARYVKLSKQHLSRAFPRIRQAE